MTTNKTIASFLFAVVLIILVGFAVKDAKFWYVIDGIVMAVCLISGIILWKKNN